MTHAIAQVCRWCIPGHVWYHALTLMCGTIDESSTVPIDREADRARIMAATTARDMYNVLRADCWVVVHIHSVLREKGGVEGGMEGTRLTLVADSSVPQGYEFSIRTPVTPARWALFDQVGCRVMQPSDCKHRHASLCMRITGAVALL